MREEAAMTTTDARAFPCGCDIPPGPAMCPEAAALWSAIGRAHDARDWGRHSMLSEIYAKHIRGNNDHG